MTDELPEDDSLFEELVGPLRGDMPDIDAHVDVILTSGQIMHFHEVQTPSLIRALNTKGFVQLADADGRNCWLFARGVAAVTSRKDDEQ